MKGSTNVMESGGISTAHDIGAIGDIVRVYNSAF